MTNAYKYTTRFERHQFELETNGTKSFPGLRKSDDPVVGFLLQFCEIVLQLGKLT